MDGHRPVRRDRGVTAQVGEYAAPSQPSERSAALGDPTRRVQGDRLPHLIQLGRIEPVACQPRHREISTFHLEPLPSLRLGAESEVMHRCRGEEQLPIETRRLACLLSDHLGEEEGPQAVIPQHLRQRVESVQYDVGESASWQRRGVHGGEASRAEARSARTFTQRKMLLSLRPTTPCGVQPPYPERATAHE